MEETHLIFPKEKKKKQRQSQTFLLLPLTTFMSILCYKIQGWPCMDKDKSFLETNMQLKKLKPQISFKNLSLNLIK